MLLIENSFYPSEGNQPPMQQSFDLVDIGGHGANDITLTLQCTDEFGNETQIKLIFGYDESVQLLNYISNL